MEKDDRTSARDRELGMERPITRRDFLNGMAIGVGGLTAASLVPEFALGAGKSTPLRQNASGYYPPALTGMRGSHDGAFSVAHALRDGKFWKSAGAPIHTRETYDLVIAGAGLSGLAAAYFYRAKNPSARILILDNHDDFGGHAKRNEFRSNGRLMLGNGGTWAIESPFPYSQEAGGLMAELGIDPPALEAKCHDRDLYRGLSQAIFFDKETFGADRLVPGAPSRSREYATPLAGNGTPWTEFLARSPLSADAQRDIARIEEDNLDYLPGLPQNEKKDRLSRTSYKDFLLNLVKAHPDVMPFYQTRTHDLYGVGIDAVPALDCWALEYPGFQGMNLDRVPSPRLTFTAQGFVTSKPAYFFHFPDGNASIARMLVRALIPAAVPGRSAEDIVTARVDYGKLDSKSSQIQIRLNSTVVGVKHVGHHASAQEVEITYGSGQRAFTVRAKATVLACWNMVIPYLCPELPDKQKEALQYGVKVPLVYTSVSVRNWTALQKLGVQRVTCPGMYHTDVTLDSAVNIGKYKSAKSPDEPILLRMTRTPCMPGSPARDQQRAGHYDLLATSFATFERNIRDQLARVLGSGGFDPARDIEAITVNRWPHGYTYEYNPLWDPDWPMGERPCDIARKPFGRIAIANSDAAAAAYTDQAFDQAYRAVQELAT